MFKTKEVEDNIHEAIRRQEYSIRSEKLQAESPDIAGYSDAVMYNAETSGAVLTGNNAVQIYTDGNAKFEALMQDMKKAKKYIHIQYYIIRNDVLFERIKDILIEKVKEGVEVRILFDAMGCVRVRKSLDEAGKRRYQNGRIFPGIVSKTESAYQLPQSQKDCRH